MHGNSSRHRHGLQGHTSKRARQILLFVISRRCSAHSAHSALLAAHELSWPVNCRWLYVEDLFMSQLQNTLAGEQASTNQTAPANNIIDTAIGAGIFTTLAAGIKAAGLTSTL